MPATNLDVQGFAVTAVPIRGSFNTVTFKGSKTKILLLPSKSFTGLLQNLSEVIRSMTSRKFHKLRIFSKQTSEPEILLCQHLYLAPFLHEFLIIVKLCFCRQDFKLICLEDVIPGSFHLSEMSLQRSDWVNTNFFSRLKTLITAVNISVKNSGTMLCTGRRAYFNEQ